MKRFLRDWAIFTACSVVVVAVRRTVGTAQYWESLVYMAMGAIPVAVVVALNDRNWQSVAEEAKRQLAVHDGWMKPYIEKWRELSGVERGTPYLGFLLEWMDNRAATAIARCNRLQEQLDQLKNQ